MTKLNDNQRDALTAIAKAPRGVPDTTVERRISALLIKQGLLASTPGDGDAKVLIATPEGRRTLGLAEKPGRKSSAAPSAPAGKSALIRSLLERKEGATIEQMTGATGWLPHSVRGHIAGALKKKLGLAVVSEKTASGRVYRIAQTARA